MNSAFSPQRLLLAAAWIGTALLAYSIGSLRSPSPAPPALEVAMEPSLSPAQAIAAAEHDDAASERPWDGGHGAPTRTLAEIVGQQPLGDYLKRILTLDDDIKRTGAFMELLETIQTPEQIREALDAVMKSGQGWGRGASSREFAMLLQKWTTLDPRAAGDYAIKVNGNGERYMAMSHVLRNWTRQDAHAALAWAEANGKAPLKQTDDNDGNIAVAMVASQLARTNIDLALRAAAIDPDSRSATRLADNLAGELYKQRGEEVARHTILALPESKLRDSMLAEHADRLAKSDGAAAARFAVTLPPGRAYSLALAEAIGGWAENKPAEAAAFLNSVPPSRDSDAAREKFAREVVEKDPLGAISWAGTITDERQRQSTTENVVRSWVRRDSAAATPWVMQSNFSDETKKRLLAPETRGRN